MKTRNPIPVVATFGKRFLAAGTRASACFNALTASAVGICLCRRWVKRRERRAPFPAFVLAALLLALAPATLRAQLVADGGTLNLTTATNLPGNLIVGTNTGKATLNIIAPGTVTNAHGFLGHTNPLSGNNKVTVQNTNAVWRNLGDLFIGTNSYANSLVISNGGRVFNTNAFLGYNAQATNNQATVTGAGSRWDTVLELYIGYGGSGNSLVITNGGQAAVAYAAVGVLPGANNNQVIVTGSGSSWTNGFLDCGYYGSSNSLVIADGGQVLTAAGSFCYIGRNAGANGNQVIVTGPGSLLTAPEGELVIGEGGSWNQLIISNGATVACFNANCGPASSNNTVLVTGTNSLWAVDSQLTFAGGAGGNQLTIANGGEWRGSYLSLLGGSKLLLANGKVTAIIVEVHGTLAGSGIISGQLINYGLLSPGNPIGTLVLSNSPIFAGLLLMDISKNGLALTNDELQVIAPLTYGGAFTVTNLGPTALSAGDSFKLFSATSYSGAFTAMTLPALSSGLMWTNQLLVNGSLKVVAQTSPAISGLTQSGTNLVLNVTGGSPGGGYTLLTSTNVALPLASWTTNSTGNFDWLGNVTLTNAVIPATPQRFFTVRVP